MINIRQGTLQLDDSPSDQSATDNSCPVRALSTCVIPPSSETELPVSLDAEFTGGTVGLIQTPQHLMDRFYIQGNAVLATTTADHTVPYSLIISLNAEVSTQEKPDTDIPDTLFISQTLP